MSNRAVAGVYRQVIDSVIQNSRADFEEMGFEDSVLSALQRSWESKLASARVADFESDNRIGPLAKEAAQQALQARQRFLLQQQQSQQNGESSSSTSANQGASSTGSTKDVKASTGSKSEAQTPKSEELPDDNLIGSDLDDSDDEEEDKAAELDDGAVGGDLVIALYEKVTRVKNKWKVQLKDGVVSANGKDYLFSKCNGEFEW